MHTTVVVKSSIDGDTGEMGRDQSQLDGSEMSMDGEEREVLRYDCQDEESEYQILTCGGKEAKI